MQAVYAQPSPKSTACWAGVGGGCQRILLIEENGEAETRERRTCRKLAGADGGMVEFSARDQASQIIRKTVQVRRFEPRDGHRLCTERQTVLIAILARIVHSRHDGKSVGLEQPRDLLFLLFAGHGGDDSSEILRRVILFPAALDGDADGVYLRVENIGAVRRGIHPSDV